MFLKAAIRPTLSHESQFAISFVQHPSCTLPSPTKTASNEKSSAICLFNRCHFRKEPVNAFGLRGLPSSTLQKICVMLVVKRISLQSEMFRFQFAKTIIGADLQASNSQGWHFVRPFDSMTRQFVILKFDLYVLLLA